MACKAAKRAAQFVGVLALTFAGAACSDAPAPPPPDAKVIAWLEAAEADLARIEEDEARDQARRFVHAAWCRLGQLDRAESLQAQATNERERDLLIRSYAVALTRAGRVGEGLTLAEKELTAGSADQVRWSYIGELRRAGRFTEALDLADRIAVEGYQQRILYEIGIAAAEAAEFDSAEQAMARLEEGSDRQNLVATAIHFMRQTARGDEQLTADPQRNFHLADAARHAPAMAELGRPKLAAQAAAAAPEAGDRARIYMLLSRSYRAAGDTEAANAAIDQALQVLDTWIAAGSRLAFPTPPRERIIVELIRLERVDEAKAMLANPALRISKRHLPWLRARLGETDEAVQTLTAVEPERQDSAARLLALVLAGQGQHDHVDQLIKRTTAPAARVRLRVAAADGRSRALAGEDVSAFGD